jgi:hypothetical protein
MTKKRLPPERLHLGWVLALVALCLVTLSVQFSHISGSVPYPYHIDEEAVIGPARKMLVTGNFHPSEFNYPSLPRYLAAAGLAVGFVRAATEDSDVRPDIHQVGSVTYPYYGTPPAVETSKQLFAVLSVIVLAMTGVIAWHLTRRPETVIIGPAILVASELFFRHSWQYLNVDIVGTCFVVLTLASCLSMTTRSSVARLAVVPAVWAGLAAASKYTLGLVFLPVLLGIWMYQEGDRRILSFGIALATVSVSFLIAMPFALLDLPAFLNGLAFDAWHYGAAGHVGFNDEPGLAQLRNYATHLMNEFGLTGAVFATVGSVAVFRLDWRRGLLLFSFPVLLVTLLAGQRVIFMRNALPLHPLYAVAIGYGFIVMYGWCMRWLTRWSQRLGGLVGKAVILFALIALALPVNRIVEHASVTPDSRNLARDWILQNLPDGWTIVIPSKLGFDIRGLADRDFLIEEVDVTTLQEQKDMLELVKGPVVALVPVWGMDERFGVTVSPDVMNATISGKRTLAEFGSNPVLINYGQATAWGDPRLIIVAPFR